MKKKNIDLKKVQKHLINFLPVLLLFCLFSFAIFIGVRKQSQSFHFEDETDHVALGWMMHRFDKGLYSDLSTNHQPFPVLVGAVFSWIIPYSTLFDLIERLRIGMFLYAVMWGVVVSYRFRWKGVFSFALTYSLGYYFFAWHVLAEAFATPAILFIFLLLFEKMFLPQTSSEKYDAILSGVALAVIAASLLPLWPLTLFAGVALLSLTSKKFRTYMIASGLVSALSIAVFISPIDWFLETVRNNLLYFLPYTPPLTGRDWLTITVYPFLSFLKPQEKIPQGFMISLIIAVVSLCIGLVKSRKVQIKTIFSSLFLYLLLIISNPRVLEFPVAFYTGFHLFPFVAAFFAITVSIAWHFSSRATPFKIVVSVLFIALFIFNSEWARRKTDKLNDYYVEYGTQDSYARLISVFKQEGDTFFSGPNGFGYMNMRADLPIAGRQLFHLQWAYNSPKLREEFHTLITQQPPTFIYFLEDESGYNADIQALVKEKYTEIIQNKHRTFLYFLNEKVKQTTPEQNKYLEEQDFHFRTPQEVEIY